MADHVIAYKKNAKKKTKSLIILYKFGSRARNGQKNGSLNRELLNFFYMYDIFWMLPGESSCPGGSEYVWQRGVEGVSG